MVDASEYINPGNWRNSKAIVEWVSLGKVVVGAPIAAFLGGIVAFIVGIGDGLVGLFGGLASALESLVERGLTVPNTIAFRFRLPASVEGASSAIPSVIELQVFGVIGGMALVLMTYYIGARVVGGAVDA